MLQCESFFRTACLLRTNIYISTLFGKEAVSELQAASLLHTASPCLKLAPLPGLL